jgi:HEAT repeat protein
MRCIQHFRHGPGSCLGALALVNLFCWAVVSRADRFPPDPVDELRRELRATLQDLKERDPDLAKKVEKLEPDKERDELNLARDRILGRQIKALKSIADMRRALLLNAWRVDRNRDEMWEVDRKNRDLLADQFISAVRRILQQGSITARLAALNAVAEVGTSARSPEDRVGIGRALQGDLAELTHADEEEEVRVAAARTLGQIFPEPKGAAKALGDLLESRDVAERRAAAEGLLSMTKVLAQLTSGNEPSGKITAGRTDLTAAGQAILPVAARGLRDPDVPVERLCADTIRQATAVLVNQVPQPSRGPETARSEIDPGALVKAREELRPLMQAFKDQSAALAYGADSRRDLHVRLLIRRALEDLGVARVMFQRFTRGELPVVGPAPGAGEAAAAKPIAQQVALQRPAPAPPEDDPILDLLKAALPALTKGLSDPELEARLRAVDALETLGPQAAPAAPELVKALHDPNLFVRWAAARTLGRIGPVRVERSVPALARLLHDQDYDVNIAAAAALDRFGPAAREAVPDLIKELAASDAEKRKAVLRSLESIGTDSKPAIPAITARLTDEDPSVRQLAAEVLGRFGPAAASAEPALRRALNDPDPDAHRAAADALLSIVQK